MKIDLTKFWFIDYENIQFFQYMDPLYVEYIDF